MSQLDLVIPDGSMHETISSLFAKAGLAIRTQKKRTNEGWVDVDWIKRIAFQRPQEIPQYLHQGHFDFAIVGEDWIANWGYEFPVLLELPIGRSGNKSVRIILAVPEDRDIQQVSDLPEGCEIATEYIQLAQTFFAGQGRPDIVVTSSFGNTEHKVRFGATGIIEVTESGTSLAENRLKIIHEIMESRTVVVTNPASYDDESKRPYIDCLTKLLKGAYQASQYVIITAHAQRGINDQAASILQGLKGPTQAPILGADDWVSLQSVIGKKQEHDVIFRLMQIGVTDIIVIRDIPLLMF